ncbi:MAG TPA: HAD-IB family hydrolase [Acidimicrobiales bacterium]|nr:HAD-IB family hydrolase [Acidimicrobiales bacterium]
MEGAFFDLDKTVIAKASMVAFGREIYREGLISRRTIAHAIWGHFVYQHLGASDAKLDEVREKALAMTKGWDQARVKEIVRETLRTVVEPIIYAEAADLIAEHKAAGRVVAIVSASPEEIVAPLGEFLGADRVLGTRARVDEGGRYTGLVDFYCAGPYKPVAMAALAHELDIDLASSYAYSDSATDVPMLEAVGHPVVVNPDRVLARMAKERDWPVLNFTQPVRLRDRMPVPSAKSGAATAGVVAAAVTAWFAWQQRQRHRAAA